VPAIVFLIITGWTVVYTAVQYPIGLLAAAILLVTGYPLFKRLRRNS
jgi:hypothetical protein